MSGSMDMLEKSIDTYDDPLLVFIQFDASRLKKPKINHTKQEVQSFNKKYYKASILNKEAESLLHLAAMYKHINAIEYLIENDIKFPAANDEFASLVVNIFNASNKLSNESNAIQIFNYLYNITEFKNRLDNLDKNILNKMLVDCTRNNSIAVIEIFSKYNFVTDVNYHDKDGHTALFYLERQQRSIDKDESNALQDYQRISDARNILVAKGAKLNTSDRNSLTQDTFRKEITRAIKNNGDVTAYLEQLKNNPSLLTDQQFLNTFHTALRANSEETVKQYLAFDRINTIDFTRDSTAISDDIKNQKIAKLVVDYASEQRINLVYSGSFDTRLRGILHVIGMSGSLKTKKNAPLTETRGFEFKLDGNTGVNGLYEVSQSLQHYQESNSEFRQFANAANYSSTASFLSNPDAYGALMHASYLKGNPTISSTGWQGHAIGIATYYDKASNQTYLAISNRGIGGVASCMKKSDINSENNAATGTVIYALDGTLPASFFADFGCFQTEKFKSQKEFSSALNTALTDADARLITILPASGQGHETCSYVNPKRLTEGLMFILELIKNKNAPIDELKMQCLEKYKTYSRADKDHAFDNLIALYQELQASPDNDDKNRQIRLMNKFIAQLYIQRGSLGIEEAQLRRVYTVLNDETKAKIPSNYIPTDQPVHQGNAKQFGLFTRPARNIQIAGSKSAINKYSDKLTALLEFLKSNGIGNDKIKSISFAGDKAHIHTGADRTIKADIRDNIFKKQLGADIKNLDGKYEFIINNFSDLNIPKPREQLKK